MKCEKYRQAIGADPGFVDASGHAEACADCRAWRADMQVLDAAIVRALAVDVPELRLPELPAVDKAAVAALQARRSSAPMAWLAIAATTAAAAIIGIRMLGGEAGSLADEVLAHVDHEKASLVVTKVPVPDAELRSIVPATVSTLDHRAGLITYARSCIINGHSVPHLVMQGEQGPVTILLMPEERVSGAVTLSGEHVNGVILPVGDGSIAIIGERGERLDSIRAEVLNSVTWAT